MQVAEKEGSRGRERCPLCHAPLGAADLPTITTCDRCGTRAHVACTRELSEGRCGTPGCERELVVRIAPVVKPAARAPALVPRRAWLIAGSLAALALLLAALGVVWSLDAQVHEHGHEHERWEATPPIPATPQYADVPYARVGQRWVYRLSNAGTPDMQMIYEVRAVEPERVRYATTIQLDMGQGLQPIGEPQPAEFPRAPRPSPPPTTTAPQQIVRVASVTVDGVELNLGRAATGNVVTYLTLDGDGNATFPGLLRSETDGATTLELIRIEQPDAPR